MVIEATTRIDYETYRKFYLFSFLQGQKFTWQGPLLIALAPVLAIAFLVLYIKDPSDVLNLIGLVMMLFITLVMAALVTIMPRRYYLSIEKQLMTPNHYRFLDDHLTVSTDMPGDLPTDYPYDTIEKAHETAGFFYINLGPGKICIIGRDDFTAGSATDLHSLLQEKIGARLVVLRKIRPQ
jgi:hypothetical protein